MLWPKESVMNAKKLFFKICPFFFFITRPVYLSRDCFGISSLLHRSPGNKYYVNEATKFHGNNMLNKRKISFYNNPILNSNNWFMGTDVNQLNYTIDPRSSGSFQVLAVHL